MIDKVNSFRFVFYLLLLINILFIYSCQNITNRTAAVSEKDYLTLSNYDEVSVYHLNLSLNINFKSSSLGGKAQLFFTNKNNSNKIILDTRDLFIEKVILDSTNIPADYILGKKDSIRGESLTIPIKSETKSVTIFYHTLSSSIALQWLNPEQTSEKKYPFLFTQSQSIYARTWIPCQDCPAVRMTYHAEIKTDPELLVLMSAVNNPKNINTNGIYQFDMPFPIPSYLMALVSGDIGYSQISGRCGVYSEKTDIQKVAWELADLEKMIMISDSLYGKYRWGRYDVIVLPPSFPFGGMENPCLTFATPTIIAGDRSLITLVAHELAHSWSGNLVTNATWDDFWLNEGFTMYFENRIIEALNGRDYSEMLAHITYQDLLKNINELGANSMDTRLKFSLKDRDPEEVSTDIAYNKGYFFLRMLEHQIGRETLDKFLKDYFNDFAFQSMTTEKFMNIFNERVIKGNIFLSEKLKINSWIYSPGIPDNLLFKGSEEFEKVNKILSKFKNAKIIESGDYQNWTTHHYVHFLRNLPEKLTFVQMKYLDSLFKFSFTGNSEILEPWLELVIKNSYKDTFPVVEKFLSGMGRRRFVEPLFINLLKNPVNREFAERIHQKTGKMYHPITRKPVDQLFK